jgi:ribosome-associated translation inhibitor RaiA
MHVEVIDRGIEITSDIEQLARDVLGTLMDHFSPDIDLVRVRLSPEGRSTTVRCKVRAWRSDGPTIVVTSCGESVADAIHTSVQILQKNIRRKKDRSASRRARGTLRKVADYELFFTPIAQ